MYILLWTECEGDTKSRRFEEFDTRDNLAHHLVKFYESYLEIIKLSEDENGADNTGQEVEYVSSDLFEYIDNTLNEVVCLQKQEEHEGLWIPNSTEWVKEIVYFYLKSAFESAM